MNTEDDTFNRLKRIPFLQMFRIWADSSTTTSTDGFEELFIAHGWTFKDYIEVHYSHFENIYK